MAKKSDEMLIEIDERISVNNAEQKFEAYCSECKKMTEMATPKAASVLCNTSEREIFRLIEDRSIHFVETDGILVCIDSVKKILTHSGSTTFEVHTTRTNKKI
jgi:hypothetical protein